MKWAERVPYESTPVQTKDESKVRGTGRAKDYAAYVNDDKPWGRPPYPLRSLHASVEIHFLYRAALRLGGNVANLGTWRGATASALAHGVKDHGNGKVYTVDVHEKHGAASIEQLSKVFKDRGMDEFVEFRKGLTNYVVDELQHLQFNFIFIDADHAYETCKQDFRLWSDLLAPGGEIAFHDVDIDTVDRVITEELGDWEQVDHVFKIKSFRRKA